MRGTSGIGALFEKKKELYRKFSSMQILSPRTLNSVYEVADLESTYLTEIARQKEEFTSRIDRITEVEKTLDARIQEFEAISKDFFKKKKDFEERRR